MAQACSREAAVSGFGNGLGDGHSEGRHNQQLVLLGLSITMVGGGIIKAATNTVALPVPFTVLLLLFGMLLGCWVLFDPAFTLQPGAPCLVTSPPCLLQELKHIQLLWQVCWPEVGAGLMRMAMPTPSSAT